GGSVVRFGRIRCRLEHEEISLWHMFFEAAIFRFQTKWVAAVRRLENRINTATNPADPKVSRTQPP
ncbi:hypothetical protein, partial [Pseudomonas frederiksbergensis]|uniref:hypothetical protein n=1 Tax=Pseudomonas frederiksbergensis TaxID=104087 RepID=UPI00197F83D8